MSRYFTHYWKNDTWEFNSNLWDKSFLEHSASNMFIKRGVQPGDFVYVITVIKGELYLEGRMKVAKILSYDEAAVELKDNNLWDAEEHLIGVPGACSPQVFDRKVPLEITKNLRLVSGVQSIPPKFKTPGLLDQQTFRGIRELTEESAIQLDKFINW